MLIALTCEAAFSSIDMGFVFQWHEVYAQLDVVAAWHVILLAEAFCVYWLLSYLWL